MGSNDTKLVVNEVFFSIQGESTRTGFPTLFIRLTGCPLRCKYCDTAYAFHEGSVYTLATLFVEIAKYHPYYITVTGGEPLSQPGCLALLTYLCDLKYHVSLETSGALSIEQVDRRVMVVMDLKTPSSGEFEKNLYSNIAFLKDGDQVKFVISDQNDYQWSKNMVKKIDAECSHQVEMLFSPVHNASTATHLAEWILHDTLNVRLQLQLHKYLWSESRGR